MRETIKCDGCGAECIEETYRLCGNEEAIGDSYVTKETKKRYKIKIVEV